MPSTTGQPPPPAEYAIALSGSPAACGSVVIGTGSGVDSGGSVQVPSGNCLVAAPTCVGDLFDSGAATGGVAVGTALMRYASAALHVTGSGSLEAIFAPAAAPSGGGASPFFSTATLLGIGPGLAVGAAATAGGSLALRYRGRPGGTGQAEVGARGRRAAPASARPAGRTGGTRTWGIGA